MGQGGARQALAAQHAGHLGHALLALHGGHGAGRARGIALLGHHQVVVRAGGHLGQVGHGHDLAVAAQLLHQPAHGFGHGAAHAGIHLVKDQCLRRAQLAGGDGNGQRNARQLAARGHLAHGPRCAAGVASDQEGHVFQPALGGLRGFFQRHFKPAALHAQALHGLGDGLGQQRRGLGALARQRARFGHVGGCGFLFGGLQRAQVGCGVQLGQLFLPARQQAGQLGRRAFVAARQRHPQRHALVQLGQALRVEVGLALPGVQRMQACPRPGPGWRPAPRPCLQIRGPRAPAPAAAPATGPGP
jgi:hypothetical protein